MHDLLQEMGQEIVRQNSLEEAGKSSRLWLYKDIYHVFMKNSVSMLEANVSYENLVLY